MGVGARPRGREPVRVAIGRTHVHVHVVRAGVLRDAHNKQWPLLEYALDLLVG